MAHPKLYIPSAIKTAYALERFAARNGQQQFLTNHWFVELGTSEGPEGFQTDSK